MARNARLRRRQRCHSSRPLKGVAACRDWSQKTQALVPVTGEMDDNQVFSRFRKMLRGTSMRTARTIAFGFLCALLFISTENRAQETKQSASQAIEFIFYGDKVRGIGHPHAWVEVG